MNIGFSNGDLYRIFSSEEERFSKKFLDIYSLNKKANCIELMFRDLEIINFVLQNELDLSNFKYISIHAPTLIGDNQKDIEILQKLEILSKKYDVCNVVIHPSKNTNWDVISKFNMPISIENMDDRKDFGKSVDEIENILNKYNFSLTIDLQHCFTNDKTLKLATDFHNKFRDRVVEYHLSGYEDKLLHYPLFITKQDEIIESLEIKNIPIIIESTFDSIGDLQKEYEYILDNI